MRASGPWCLTLTTGKPRPCSSDSAAATVRSAVDRDALSVREPGGQAGRRRLLRGGQPQLAAEGPHFVLGETRVGKGPLHPGFVRGEASRTIVGLVVGYRAVNDGREAGLLAHDFQGCVELTRRHT